MKSTSFHVLALFQEREFSWGRMTKMCQGRRCPNLQPMNLSDLEQLPLLPPTQALDGEVIDFPGLCFSFLGAFCAIEIPHVTLTHFYSSLSCARTEMKKNNPR